MTDRGGRWNHNLHYHPLLLEAMPEWCERALDVGCGEGTLARRLRRSLDHVSAIDIDETSIEIARRQGPDAGIRYLVGDFLSFPFEPASFDFVVCVAALHHMDATAALEKMAGLLRPGGALAVLGLVRSRYPADLPRDAAATIVNRARSFTSEYWESPAPTVWPPPQTYGQIRVLAEGTLPHARLRRHLLWRYSITWTREREVSARGLAAGFASARRLSSAAPWAAGPAAATAQRARGWWRRCARVAGRTATAAAPRGPAARASPRGTRSLPARAGG